jgi:hypothetical protein
MNLSTLDWGIIVAFFEPEKVILNFSSQEETCPGGF